MKRHAIQITCCALLAAATLSAQTAPLDGEAAVLAAEAAISQAKIHNDVATLNRLVADDYLGYNQWGVRRDKKDLLALFRTFETTGLVPSKVSVRVSGDVAIVDGSMNESNAWKFLFLRTYVKRDGRWQLLSSVQTFPVNPENMTAFDPALLPQ
jgi:hypothetical protein